MQDKQPLHKLSLRQYKRLLGIQSEEQLIEVLQEFDQLTETCGLSGLSGLRALRALSGIFWFGLL